MEMEGYSNAGPLNTNNHAPAGGRRRGHGTKKHHPKLRLVKKKTVRRMLKKMGMRMRGGVDDEVPLTAGMKGMGMHGKGMKGMGMYGGVSEGMVPSAATPVTPPTPTTTTGGAASALTPGQTAGRRRRHKKKGLMGLF